MSDYATTYGPMTTAKMPTWDDMQKMIDEVRSKLPPANERCVAIEMPPTTEDDLLHACDQMFPRPADRFGSLCGLPIRTRLDVPSHAYVVKMADGAEVMHYANGRTVRCLLASAEPNEPAGRES